MTLPADAIVKHGGQDLPAADARVPLPPRAPTTTELDASHMSMLSKPNEVAAVIMDAAAKVSH